MRLQVILLADEDPLGLEVSIASFCTGSLQGRIELAIVTRTGRALGREFWEGCSDLLEQAERFDLKISTGVSNAFDIGEISATRLMLLEAGDVVFPDALLSVMESKYEAAEIIVTMEKSSDSTATPEWITSLANSGKTCSVLSRPQLLSISDYRGKIYSSAYLYGMLGALKSWDSASLSEVSYLAMLGAQRVSVVNEIIYAQPGLLCDSASGADASGWRTFIRTVEAGYARYSRLTPEQRKAVDYHFVREGMKIFLTAREVLDDGELRQLFSRARPLAAQCSYHRILGIAGSLRYRVAFYALLADDFEMFADPGAAISSLTAVDNAPYLSTNQPVPDNLRELIEVKAPRVFAEYSFVDEQGRLFLSGRAVFPGLFSAELLGVTGKLRVGSQMASHPFTMQVRRPLPEINSHGLYEWIAEVVPEKEFFRSPIDFQVETMSGEFTVRLRYTLGFMRTSRSLVTQRGITQFFPADDHRVVIKHFDANRRPRLRFAWWKSMVRDDLRAYQAGRPLSSWLVVRLFTGFLRRRNYWLLGERSDTAQDNSSILFQWLRKEARGVRPRYVLEKGTDAWEQLKGSGGVVPHGSLRHKLILLHAKVLVSTQDIDSYMVPNDWDRAEFRLELAPRLNQRRVFLQHGVTHNGVGPQLHRGITGLDLLVCASPQEAAYLRSTTGYDTEIVETGFPRFDRLFEARSKEKSRHILLMPTWRRYLVAPSYDQNAEDPGNFVGSRYEQFFTQLLTDERLQGSLEEAEVSIDFVPHYETAPYFTAQKSHPRINIITDGGARLPELLASTPLLVTDYSSVMFDVAYAGGGVVQLLFDYEEFYSRHYAQGWYDPKTQGLGVNAYDVEAAVEVILNLIQSNFIVDKALEVRVNSYFSQHDALSRARVYEEILHVASTDKRGTTQGKLARKRR